MPAFDLADSAHTDAIGSTIDSAANAQTAQTNFLEATTKLSGDRATAGITQSRLTYASETLTVRTEYITAASSRIMDVDVAAESTE